MVGCDGLLYDLVLRVSLSVRKVNNIWLPWLLMIIHEMVNVTLFSFLSKELGLT